MSRKVLGDRKDVLINVGLEGSRSTEMQKCLQGNSVGGPGGLQKVVHSTLTSIIPAGGFELPLGGEVEAGYAAFEFTSAPVAVETY